MRVCTASAGGDPKTPNEDWACASEGLVVVLDRATARTDTGCRHGVAWYTAKLGSALTGNAVDREVRLGDALADAIQSTADQHRDCDLTHPGTPSAAVAVFRLNGDVVEYLVLGDVTIVADTTGGVQVITDDRVNSTAKAERAEADRYPFGSAEKLLRDTGNEHVEDIAGEHETKCLMFMLAASCSPCRDEVRTRSRPRIVKLPRRCRSSARWPRLRCGSACHRTSHAVIAVGSGETGSIISLAPWCSSRRRTSR